MVCVICNCYTEPLTLCIDCYKKIKLSLCGRCNQEAFIYDKQQCLLCDFESCSQCDVMLSKNEKKCSNCEKNNRMCDIFKAFLFCCFVAYCGLVYNIYFKFVKYVYIIAVKHPLYIQKDSNS